MSEIRFEFCPLDRPLVPYMLERESATDALYVFPNANSAGYALKYYQDSWQFSNTEMITIEALKDRVFLANKPLLREEKRTLAFYACLTAQDKSLFKIRSYFQSIELAQHFFSLWGEFNDECVDSRIVERLYQEGSVEFLDWQIEQFRQLVQIKEQYRSYIDSKGFTDNLYVRTRENISIALPQIPARVIFVNQFYYTRLEKAIIHALQDAGVEVVLYYHFPDTLLNRETLDVHTHSVQDLLTSALHPDITIIENSNDFSTMISLMQVLDKHPGLHLIDPAFSRNSWAGMLSSNRFNLGDSVSFTRSTIYRFFTSLHTLLDAIIREEQHGQYLLPFEALLTVAHVPEFINYFTPDGDETSRKQLLDVLYDLIDRDYRYFDLDPDAESPGHYDKLLALVKPLPVFLHNLANMHSLQQWIDLVDNPQNGIIIQQLVNRAEHDHSNLREVFYRILADLKAIESIGIVTSWDDYLNIGAHPAGRFRSSASLLRIMLDYMKAKTFHWNYQREKNRTEISSLNDTRNINYPAVAVLNVIEGKIPSQRKRPFLFTDKQRQHMGFKTWEDIRQREHYYFTRLVLTTPKVFLFTMKNTEKDIEVSSFIEELRLHLPEAQVRYITNPPQACGPVYNALLNPTDYKPSREVVRQPGFYRIPLDKTVDFPHHRIQLSYTSFRDLKNNPFVYYVKDMCRIDEKLLTVGTDFSPRLIGNLAHDLVTECWRLLNPNGVNPFAFDRDKVTDALVYQALERIAGWTKYKYSIPQDYTRIFFQTITRSNLAAGVQGFFDKLVELGLDKSCYVYPEEEESTDMEKRFKTFVPAADTELELGIAFRGRADLRINDPDDGMKYIFDFKTGQYQREQLLIYELFYHLLDHPEDAAQIQSWFYQLFKNEAKELRDFTSSRGGLKTKDDLVRVFMQDLHVIAADLARNGFGLPTLKSKLNDMPHITRKDLFLAQRFDEEPS